MKDIVTTFVFALLLLIPFGLSFASSSPDGASAYIISPANGATVGQDVTVSVCHLHLHHPMGRPLILFHQPMARL
jgi:hypothetical protein